MNQAQHIWLAIMTEIAMDRLNEQSAALYSVWLKHTRAAWPDISNEFRSHRYAYVLPD